MQQVRKQFNQFKTIKMQNPIEMHTSKQCSHSQRRIARNTNNDYSTDNDHLQQHLQSQPTSISTSTSNHHANGAHIGNMITISSRLNLSLGPDCTLFPYPQLDAFFAIGYIMVLTVTSILLYSSFTLIKKQQQQSGFFYKFMRAATMFMAVWVNGAYVVTAVGDPGVYRPGKIFITQSDTLRNCPICSFTIPSNVRHCNTCNVCIIGLDHHCPWMSKCVGRNNIRSFYAFIIGVFVMMGLFWLTVFIVLTQQ